MKLVVLLSLYLSSLNAHAYWWTTGMSWGILTPKAMKRFHKFTRAQRHMLRDSPYLLSAVSEGARRAIMECKWQFQFNRWNCSNYNSETAFGKILNTACKETAFIHAITSAGATYYVTKKCAQGKILDCNSCIPAKREPLKSAIYEGCHDNVKFGYTLGKQFTDATEITSDIKTTINLHNNEVGRLTVTKSLSTICKCHGVSGSCKVQSCSQKLDDFRKIGNRLKLGYEVAVKVNRFQVLQPNQRIVKKSNIHEANEPSPIQLIYAEDSPDFCKRDLSKGSLGVQERICDDSVKGAEGERLCKKLCCGRKVLKKVVTLSKKCHCKFNWCCDVKCDMCKETKEISYCS